MSRTRSGKSGRGANLTRPLRRRAAVTTSGVGALVDFPYETLLAAGLDRWPQREEEPPQDDGLVLHDPRLEKLLRVTYFRAAPVYEKGRKKEEYCLPFVRFPTWLRCPRCHRLTKTDLTTRQIPKCENEAPPRGYPKAKPCAKLGPRKRRLIPVRFLTACKEGHLEDFPWSAWVHTLKGQTLSRDAACPNGGKPELYLEQPGFGGLSNVLIRCTTCRTARTLVGAGGEHGIKALQCSGKRPWLGEKNLEDEACGEGLSLVQKGASRLHQPTLESALLIPRSPAQFEHMLKRPKLRRRLRLDDLEAPPPTEETIADVADYEDLDPTMLYQAVEAHFRHRTELPSTHLGLRYEEYRTLMNWKDYEVDSEDLIVREADLNQLSSELRPLFSNLLLVDRLTETQVLIGFSRLGKTPGPFEVNWGHLSRRRQNWLPAYRVHGEGIFLTLNQERLADWSKALRSTDGWPPQRPKKLAGAPESYLLHTLAHILIRRLSFECGYGASALRERLYCHTQKSPQEPPSMAGILIYTAAGDSEGTLGGLVRQGEPANLSLILINAIEEARWCSADPLCCESQGQGPDSTNLAACHACCLLPETSCEAGNRGLDRRVLIGDSSRPGYFAEIGSR